MVRLKIFLIILLLGTFPAFTHAQVAKVVLSSDGSNNLVVTVSPNKPIDNKISYLPVVSESEVKDTAINTPAGGNAGQFITNPVEVKIAGLKRNIPYHVRVIEIQGTTRKFVSADQTITIPGITIKIPPPTFSRKNNIYTLSGFVDTSSFSPSELSLSASLFSVSGGEAVWNFIPNPKQNIKSDGTYSFSVTSDSFSETYYNLVVNAESIYGDTGTIKIKVDAKKGTVIPTDTAGIAAYEKNRSYTLLAPLPGISKILDNDLCQEAQKTNPNEICDINQFINFVLKFMIGLAAVILVVRLILDGYNYMTTDIPFVQAKAKTGFRDAFIGLLVALSSYLILNTINPRLVKNEFSIDSVSFNAETFRELGIDYNANEKSFEKIGPEGASCDPNIKPAKINFSGKGFQYIKSDYLPTQEKAVPTATKGSKSLMTAQAMKEGFWPVTKAWRTNNPGNIGNRDDGSTNQLASLDVGIKRQLTLLTDIIQNREPNYKIGRVVKIPTATGDDGKKYPALNFIYDGSICQYLSIYATGARHNTSYMSLIMGYFESNGLKITPKTKLSEIYGMK